MDLRVASGGGARGLAALIAACLDPDPAARPEPGAVAVELEELADGLRRRLVLGRFRVRPR